MSSDHVADLAAPYALGALSDEERAAFETHVRTCTSCAATAGAAERDVALVASMEARHSAPPILSTSSFSRPPNQYLETVPRRLNAFIVPREMLHAHTWCRWTFMEDHASLPAYASKPRVCG